LGGNTVTKTAELFQAKQALHFAFIRTQSPAALLQHPLHLGVSPQTESSGLLPQQFYAFGIFTASLLNRV
jgi:hypothetical protein